MAAFDRGGVVVRAWLRRSFRNRVFVMMLLAAFVPLLVCGPLMLCLQVVRSEESLAAEADEQLEALEGALSDLQGRCERAMGELCSSTVVRSALRRGGSDSHTLYQTLFRAAGPLREYARLEVYDSTGQPCYTTGSALPEAAEDPGWGALYAAGQAEGPALCANGDGLACAQAVRSREGAVLGYVAVTVSQGGFDRLFGGLYSASCEVILLDRSWRTIYGSQPSQSRATAESLRRQLLAGDEPAGRSYRFFAAKHAGTGFSLLLQQPRPFTSLVLRSFYLVGVFAGALCLLLCMWCAWVLSRYLSRPVHQLDEAMGEVEQGRLDVRLETGRDDELGRLSSRFNRMADEYRLNLERSVQRERELNNVRLRMFQAQLNPHFLYNTLDAMKWLGIAHQAPQVAALATDLATILRASISGDELVTLEQELELIDRDVNIQLIRFEDSFAFEIDIAERFQGCLVPKLALQPLVENAVIHGVAGRDDGYIKLQAGDEGGDLLLYVSDNGCGIPPETLARLNSGDKRIPGGHLGLFNTDSIIRMYFGTGYGVFARSSPGEGSCVWLRLPLRRKENGNAEGLDC